MQYEEQEYNKRFDLAVWKDLFRFAKPYYRKLILLLVLMVFIGLFDAVLPLLSKIAIDDIALPGRFDLMPWVAAGALVLITVQSLNVRWMILISGWLECQVPYDIRKAGFAKIQSMPLAYFDRTPVGWLMARLTSDCSRLGNVLSWVSVDLFWSIAMMIFSIVMMFVMDARLAVLVLVTVPVLVTVSILFQKRILFNFRKVRKFNSQVVAGFNEGITGARTIKSLRIENDMQQDFGRHTGSMRDFSVRSATISGLYTPIVLLLGAIGTGLVLWRGGNLTRLPAPHGLTPGTLAAFISFAVQFFDPVRQFARIFTDLNYTQASAERVMTLLNSEPEIRDSAAVESSYGSMLESDRSQWPPFGGRITFENVSFHYKEGEPILENFNLEVAPGEKIALVGETGSGKTTIVNLACRFYEPTSGRILIDGVDYRERPLLWMYANIGYVLQEPHLFSGTVSENIAYGRTDATPEQIRRAAEIVRADAFIQNLDKGYDSQVGERGSRLSTGQKQLISFARAILADPGLFVLDEATSSVDTETERLIQDAMNQALLGRTSLIIAHRLSTIRSADRILVIEKGQIVEQGTQTELLRQKGHYWRLYTNQFLSEDVRIDERVVGSASQGLEA